MHYSSRYISFEPIVLYDRQGRTVEHPTPAQARAVGSFDRNGTIPAVDLGGAYATLGPLFSPARLQGLSAAGIAGELASPTSALAPYIDAEANILTAALCVATGRQPATVCRAPGVIAAAMSLPSQASSR